MRILQLAFSKMGKLTTIMADQAELKRWIARFSV
jgi:hypothetical protein